MRWLRVGQRLAPAAAGVLLGTAWALAAPTSVRAQDFERVIPVPPTPKEPPKLEPPPAPPAPAQDGTVLAPRLNGLVFVGDLSALRTEGVDPASVPGGLSTAALPLLSTPEFMSAASAYLGRPLTRGDLDQIIALARQTYRTAGHPFVEVIAPPQNIQSGVVQIVVTEYRAGEVTVTGNEHFSSDLILHMGDLKPGATLTLPVLREALDAYNQNPFLTVDAVVKPGAQTGVTDIALEAKDRRPLRVYAGYDNQGVELLGVDEWNVGFNWGNAFGTGSIFSYQFTRSISGRYTSHSFSNVTPLRGGDRLLLFGAYATQHPEIAIGFKSEGSSGQVSGRYFHVLGGGPKLKHSLQLGIDYKRVDNNLEFGGFRILDTAVEIVQFPLIYRLTTTDRWGQTDIENAAVYSPGDFTHLNTDEAFRRLVPGAEANYAYDRLSITRTTFLPGKFSWVVRGLGQITTGNLPYSEQLGAGGLGSVRGYDPNVALGSRGIIASAELRTPSFSPLKAATGGDVDDQLQFAVFVDYASLDQPDPFLDIESDVELASAGISIHYSVSDNFTLQLEIGTQLRDAPGSRDRDTQVAIVTSIGF